MSPEIQITEIQQQQKIKEKLNICFTEIPFLEIQKNRNTEIQMIEIQKYKLQKKRNTNYVRADIKFMELQKYKWKIWIVKRRKIVMGEYE